MFRTLINMRIAVHTALRNDNEIGVGYRIRHRHLQRGGMGRGLYYGQQIRQRRTAVVEEIVDAGEQFNFGLEAGSKPELVAALAMQKGPETLIICNGYKDPGFIRIALLGRKLGKPVVIVAEKLEEVEQIIRASKEVGVEPWIGIRARLHSKGSGKWSPSGGENAKFGLD